MSPAAPSPIRSKLGKLAGQLPYFPQALELVWTAAPRHAAGWTALLLLQGLLPVATVYLTRSLVDSLTAVLRSPSPWSRTEPILTIAGVLIAVLLLGEAARAAASWISATQAELVRDHISGLIQRKSAEVDLAFYDNADFYDRLHRARDEGIYRPTALIENLGGILQNGITLVSMLGVLIPFGVWLPAALAVSTLPALYVVLRHALYQHRWRLRASEDERRAWYCEWVLTSGENAAELRLFGLGGSFRSRYSALRRGLRQEKSRLAAAQSRAEFAAGIAGFAVAGCASAVVLVRVIRGAASLGDLAMVYQAFHQGLRLMESLLKNVGHVYQNSLYLGNLFEFLALQPTIADGPVPVPVPEVLRDGIRFTGAGFRYPNRDWVLRNFDLFIPAGKIVTIVGPNGAGKSTLVKLLCRLYDPVEGRVELDGVDLRSLAVEDLRRRITVLFQQPVHYNMTVAENIAMGRIDSSPSQADIEAAATAAGATTIIDRLSNGFDSLLGNSFRTGTELSAGEWQRIALARAFLRPAPLIIFDEPTSAMDPWAEADWLKRFRTLVAGRTAVIITHRFTTAMFADWIHVMNNGQIVESGRHGELLSQGGLYAAGWTAQSERAS